MQEKWLLPELEEKWGLTKEERTLLERRDPDNHLGFCLLLKFFQLEGYFPSSLTDIPSQAAQYVAEQLGISPNSPIRLPLSGRLAKTYRTDIRSFTGFRVATDADLMTAQAWIEQKLLLEEEQSHLFGGLCRWYLEQRIELPGKVRLHRLLQKCIYKTEECFFSFVYGSLSASACAKLDDMLKASEDFRTVFTRLKADPARPSLGTVMQELSRLESINAIGLPSTLFQHVSAKTISKYRMRAGTESVAELRQHPAAIRYTLLAAFCHERRQEIIDGLAELLIQLLHKLRKKAEKKVIQSLVGDIKAVHGKNRLLYQLAEAALDKPDGVVKDVLFPVVNKETLAALVKEYQAKGLFQKQVQVIIQNSYKGHYRRMVPKILDALGFRSNNAHHRPVVEALDYCQ